MLKKKNKNINLNINIIPGSQKSSLINYDNSTIHNIKHIRQYILLSCSSVETQIIKMYLNNDKKKKLL